MMPLREGLEPRLRGVVADVLDHPGSLARAQLASGLGVRRGGHESGHDGEYGSVPQDHEFLSPSRRRFPRDDVRFTGREVRGLS
jgi:hypothetical protein